MSVAVFRREAFANRLAKDGQPAPSQVAAHLPADHVDHPPIHLIVAEKNAPADAVPLADVSAANVVQRLNALPALAELGAVDRVPLQAVAAAPALEESREEVPGILGPPSPEGVGRGLIAPLPAQSLYLVEQGAVDQGGVLLRLDDPVLLGILLEAVPGLGGSRGGLAPGDPMELAQRPPVPDRVPHVVQILKEFVDRRRRPAPVMNGRPVRVPRRRNPFRVELPRDRPVAPSGGVHVEDPPNHRDPFRKTRNELRVVLLRKGEALAARERPFVTAVDLQDHLVAVRHESDDHVRLDGAVVVEEVEAVGRGAAQPPAVLGKRDLPPDGHLRKVLRFLTRLPLFHGADEIVGIVPGEVLADINDLDARLPQEEAVMPGFVVVDAAEPLDVVDQDVAPTA